MEIRGLSFAVVLWGAVALAQTPTTDAGTQGRHVVIVPAPPAPAPAPQPAPPGHIVIVPAQPSAPPQAVAPAPDTQRHVVIVPANPQTSSPPAAEPRQKIVIVPATPQAPAANPSEPQQKIVIVPANPQAPAAAPEPERKVTIVPAQPEADGTQAPSAANPAPTATAPVAPPSPEAGAGNTPSDGTDVEMANPDDETAPEAPAGDGMRTVTASPDLAPSPTVPVAQPAPAAPASASAVATAPVAPDGTTDSHARVGPFLSGPGSLTFILHHTLMGAAGGFATQGISNGFASDTGGREALLAGTLVGAGIGFGTSSWWQFNHWTGKTSANFGIVNSLSGGMFLTGLLDLTTDDSTALAWSSFLGAELGSWLTAGIGGGDMPFETGLLVASGESWGAIYGALLLAIVRFSGSSLRTESALDALFITQGAGAILTAFAAGHFHPSTMQILRADLSGAIVGGAVLLISALVLGHLDSPTPYILSMASSATTMALVSVLWDAGAESPKVALGGGSAPYRSLW